MSEIHTVVPPVYECKFMAYSNEKPGVLTETLGVYSEPRGVQVGRLAGVWLCIRSEMEFHGNSSFICSKKQQKAC